MRVPARNKPSRFGALLIGFLAAIACAAPASSSAAKVPEQFWGVSAFLPSEDDYDRMGKTGFGTFRIGVDWAAAQDKRGGSFHWAAADHEFRQAALAGMQPQPLLYGTPKFVSRSGEVVPPTESRKDRESWQVFVEAAAKRYGPGGDFWQENSGVPERPVKRWIIWNEQNAKAFWQPKPSPRDYATLIEISDKALESANKGSNIILGGMFGYPNDPNPSAKDFYRRLYQVKGIESHFEAINVHPYGAGVATVKKQIGEARKAAKKAGDRDVNVFVGEMGWAATGPKSSEEVVGSQGQANRLRKGLKLLAKKRDSWNIVGVAVYLWRDFNQETSCPWCPGAGLVKVNGDAKPSLKAVQKTIREFR